MAVDLVVTIMETLATGGGSSSGTGTVTRILSMSAAERLLFSRHVNATAFFKNISHQTANWVARIRQLRHLGDLSYLKELARLNGGSFVYQSAMAKLAAEEALVSHAARIATANAAATAAKGTLVAGAGTTVAAVVIPVVAMAAVGVALGAPYYQAREEAKKEEFASGFAKGFITGLLKWELRFTIDRFWDNAVGKNGFDESMPAIRAAAHNEGLLKGRVAGLAKDDGEKKDYLLGLSKLTGASTANWTARSDNWNERMRARQVQISYVIAQAVAARKHGIVAAE